MARASDTRRTRATIYAPLRAGQYSAGQEREIAYITPRFLDGIDGTAIRKLPVAQQRETVLVFFLANCTVAKGPYFGFSDSVGPSGFATESGILIGGFGQAPWFEGGRASRLMALEFGDLVDDTVIQEAASLFEGLWDWKPEPKVVLAASYAETTSALLEEVESYAALIERLGPEHGRIGHNVSEADAITPKEKAHILTATKEMRLAVDLGADLDTVRAIWDGTAEVRSKVGKYLVAILIAAATAGAVASGKSIGEQVPYMLGQAIEVWQGERSVHNALHQAAEHWVKDK